MEQITVPQQELLYKLWKWGNASENLDLEDWQIIDKFLDTSNSNAMMTSPKFKKVVGKFYSNELKLSFNKIRLKYLKSQKT